MSLDCCSSGSAVRHVLEQRRPQHAVDLRLIADTEAAAREHPNKEPLLVLAGLVRMDQQGLLCTRTAASRPPSIDPAWQACFTGRPRRGAETFMHHLTWDCKSSVQPHHCTGAATHSPCICYWRSTRGAGHACLRPGPVAPEAWSCGAWPHLSTRPARERLKEPGELMACEAGVS
jgi:hypothetical protein